MPLICATSHGITPRARDGGLIADALSVLGEGKQASVEIVDEKTVMKMAKDSGLNLTRVAGNVYESKSKREFWAVRNGKLVRLTGSNSEVDDGESIQAADHSNPEHSLRAILADLEF